VLELCAKLDEAITAPPETCGGEDQVPIRIEIFRSLRNQAVDRLFPAYVFFPALVASNMAMIFFAVFGLRLVLIASLHPTPPTEPTALG
jgi:hypothetical protein